MDVVLRLTNEVTEAFPAAQIRMVIATGLCNAETWGEVDKRLGELETAAREGTRPPYDEEHPAIASWHEAYRKFGTNPRRTRPSVDALTRRLARQGKLPRINGAVDAYNLVSVHFRLPAGAFNLSTLDGEVLIRFATSWDRFTPLGEPDVVEQPVPGEVVYAQGRQVLTRHWNHRDAHHSRVHEKTTDAVFILERVSDVVSTDTLVAAEGELADLLRPHADHLTTASVDATTPAVMLANDGETR